MDLITVAMGLSQFAPSLVKWITGSDKAEEVAKVAVDVAQQITGTKTSDEAIKALQASPEMVLAYRKAMLDQEVTFQQLAVQNASDINDTMRAEAASEHWPTYTWRPAIGLAVAFDVAACSVAVVLVYGLAMYSGETSALQYLPGMLAAMAGLIAVVSPILGIASWFRGKMQSGQDK
jgi:hypothetical protein